MAYGNAVPKVPYPRPQGWLQQLAERMPRRTEEQRQSFRASVERLQRIAAANGLSDMTPEEINEEIALVRAGK